MSIMKTEITKWHCCYFICAFNSLVELFFDQPFWLKLPEQQKFSYITENFYFSSSVIVILYMFCHVWNACMKPLENKSKNKKAPKRKGMLKIFMFLQQSNLLPAYLLDYSIIICIKYHFSCIFLSWYRIIFPTYI